MKFKQILEETIEIDELSEADIDFANEMVEYFGDSVIDDLAEGTFEEKYLHDDMFESEELDEESDKKKIINKVNKEKEASKLGPKADSLAFKAKHRWDAKLKKFVKKDGTVGALKKKMRDSAKRFKKGSFQKKAQRTKGKAKAGRNAILRQKLRKSKGLKSGDE